MRKREREREKERELSQALPPIQPSTLIHLTLVTPSLARRSSIPHSSSITEPNDADSRWVRAQTHTDPDKRTRSNSLRVMPSSASRSLVQPVWSPSQTQTHSEFSRTSWLFYTSNPHTYLTSNPQTHLTSDPHTSRIHIPSNSDMPKSTTHPPDPPLGSDLCIIYIYIYLFIYINIYIFIYLLIFLIIHFLLNCVLFMGYAYEILELDWFLQVIHDWFLLWFFLEFWSLIGYSWLVFAVIFFRIWLVGLCVELLLWLFIYLFIF